MGNLYVKIYKIYKFLVWGASPAEQIFLYVPNAIPERILINIKYESTMSIINIYI